jgi:hypothetical protein
MLLHAEVDPECEPSPAYDASTRYRPWLSPVIFTAAALDEFSAKLAVVVVTQTPELFFFCSVNRTCWPATFGETVAVYVGFLPR